MARLDQLHHPRVLGLQLNGRKAFASAEFFWQRTASIMTEQADRHGCNAVVLVFNDVNLEAATERGLVQRLIDAAPVRVRSRLLFVVPPTASSSSSASALNARQEGALRKLAEAFWLARYSEVVVTQLGDNARSRESDREDERNGSSSNAQLSRFAIELRGLEISPTGSAAPFPYHDLDGEHPYPGIRHNEWPALVGDDTRAAEVDVEAIGETRSFRIEVEENDKNAPGQEGRGASDPMLRAHAAARGRVRGRSGSRNHSAEHYLSDRDWPPSDLLAQSMLWGIPGKPTPAEVLSGMRAFRKLPLPEAERIFRRRRDYVSTALSQLSEGERGAVRYAVEEFARYGAAHINEMRAYRVGEMLETTLRIDRKGLPEPYYRAAYPTSIAACFLRNSKKPRMDYAVALDCALWHGIKRALRVLLHQGRSAAGAPAEDVKNRQSDELLVRNLFQDERPWEVVEGHQPEPAQQDFLQSDDLRRVRWREVCVAKRMLRERKALLRGTGQGVVVAHVRTGDVLDDEAAPVEAFWTEWTPYLHTRSFRPFYVPPGKAWEALEYDKVAGTADKLLVVSNPNHRRTWMGTGTGTKNENLKSMQYLEKVRALLARRMPNVRYQVPLFADSVDIIQIPPEVDLQQRYADNDLYNMAAGATGFIAGGQSQFSTLAQALSRCLEEPTLTLPQEDEAAGPGGEGGEPRATEWCTGLHFSRGAEESGGGGVGSSIRVPDSTAVGSEQEASDELGGKDRNPLVVLRTRRKEQDL
eukprot:g11673.t1